VRDVGGGGRNNGKLREREREREEGRKRGIFITCSGREGKEGSAVSRDKR